MTAAATPVHIVKVSHGYDRWEWLCDQHIAEARQRGADVKIKRREEFPQSNTKGLTCDRCPPKPERSS